MGKKVERTNHGDRIYRSNSERCRTAGRITPPEYVPRLLAYQIKSEGLLTKNKKNDILLEKDKDKRNVSVIQDVDGNKIVIINDIRFKGKRSINWKEVRAYLKEFVGEFLYDVIDIKKETSTPLES